MPIRLSRSVRRCLAVFIALLLVGASLTPAYAAADTGGRFQVPGSGGIVAQISSSLRNIFNTVVTGIGGGGLGLGALIALSALGAPDIAAIVAGCLVTGITMAAIRAVIDSDSPGWHLLHDDGAATTPAPDRSGTLLGVSMCTLR